jgi:hypothetical protein
MAALWLRVPQQQGTSSLHEADGDGRAKDEAAAPSHTVVEGIHRVTVVACMGWSRRRDWLAEVRRDCAAARRDSDADKDWAPMDDEDAYHAWADTGTGSRRAMVGTVSLLVPGALPTPPLALEWPPQQLLGLEKTASVRARPRLRRQTALHRTAHFHVPFDAVPAVAVPSAVVALPATVPAAATTWQSRSLQQQPRRPRQRKAAALLRPVRASRWQRQRRSHQAPRLRLEELRTSARRQQQEPTVSEPPVDIAQRTRCVVESQAE